MTRNRTASRHDHLTSRLAAAFGGFPVFELVREPRTRLSLAGVQSVRYARLELQRPYAPDNSMGASTSQRRAETDDVNSKRKTSVYTVSCMVQLFVAGAVFRPDSKNS